MNPRHQQFINEYFNCCMNATEAYQRVYQNATRETARRNGHELLTNTDISEEIKLRITEKAMSADEVLMRLGDQARGDMADFWHIPEQGDPTINLAKAKGKTHIIKKLKVKKTTQRIGKTTETTHEVDFDLYDAQSALQLIGKNHDLFIDKLQVKIEKELEKTLDLLEKKLDADTYRRVLDAISSAETPR